MKKFGAWLVIFVFLILFPLSATAADRTAYVSPVTSRVEVDNTTIKAYPYDQIDREASKAGLMRIVTYFKAADGGPVYQKVGDKVDFFVKTSGVDVIGWVDLNDDDDYDPGEELTAQYYSKENAYYIQGAKLKRLGSVTMYIGAKEAGTLKIEVYTSENGKKGALLNNFSCNVLENQSSITLSAYNSDDEYSLSGHSGTLADPHELTPGDSVIIRAKVAIAGKGANDKDVSFYESVDGAAPVKLETLKTDAEGYVDIKIRKDKKGIYSYYAAYEGKKSEKIYLDFNPTEYRDIVPVTPNKHVLALNELYNVTFRLLDRYDNPVIDGEVETVTVEVERAPSGSSYKGYLEHIESNTEGLVQMSFKPDRIGEYRIKATYKQYSADVVINVLPFGTPKSIDVLIKSGAEEIPAVRYFDVNNDNFPEEAGYIEARLRDANGAEFIANGSTQYKVTYWENSDAIDITLNGAITVKDKNFVGYVPITVTETSTKIKKTFNLLVAGQPAALTSNIKTNGTKAEVTLQYIDSKGNKTFYMDGESYSLNLPAGINAYYVKKFNRAGQAEFILIADDNVKYDFKVSTTKTKLNKAITVDFTPKNATPVNNSTNKVVMFIGVPSYIQNGVSKISEVAPFIKVNRTFVAIRPIAEAFGAEIGWDAVTQTVTLTKGDLKVKVVIGAKRIEKNSNGVISYVEADVPAFIKDGRTVLPFRAVGEAFNAKVEYDPATNSVSYTF